MDSVPHVQLDHCDAAVSLVQPDSIHPIQLNQPDCDDNLVESADPIDNIPTRENNFLN